MRFEVISAFAIGGVIPILATCPRYFRHGFSFMLADNIQDYLAGTLLLFAGWVSVRGRSFAPVFLVLAWAYCTSMMVSSSWGQIEDTIRGEIEPYNATVILTKLALLSTCVVSLVLSFRRVSRTSAGWMHYGWWRYYQLGAKAGIL